MPDQPSHPRLDPHPTGFPTAALRGPTSENWLPPQVLFISRVYLHKQEENRAAEMVFRLFVMNVMQDDRVQDQAQMHDFQKESNSVACSFKGGVG